MRNVLIDTNIYTAFKKGEKSIIDAFKNFDSIGIDITVIAELLSGFKCGSKEERNRRELKYFINNQRVRLLYHNFETAEFYSSIYLSLRFKGTPIPTNDIWIAATAMQNGIAIFTKDRHFTKIDGLMVVEA